MNVFVGGLRETGASAPVVAEFVDAICDACVMRWPPTGSDGLLVGKLQYVVRDDDLKLAETVLVTSGLIIASAYPGGPINPGLVVAAAVGTWRTVLAAVRKGARLEPLQFAIVAILRSKGPSSTIDIMNALIAAGHEVSEVSILTTLKALGKVALRDGSIVQIVAQDAGDRWTACGV